MQLEANSAKTHDYRAPKRGWGWDIHYKPLPGNRLRAGGWGRGLSAGDYLLLSNPDTGAETRYRVGDDLTKPSDQWFATLEFAPRTKATPPKRGRRAQKDAS